MQTEPLPDAGSSPALRPDPALVSVVCSDAAVVIVCGHYGVGKTNLALNLALACSAAGEQVTLADLDLVNPYFRSSDYPEVLARAGVRLAAPTFAGTTLDTPSLGGQLATEIELALSQSPTTEPARTRRLIVDVGGDDAGAYALGGYAGALRKDGVRMLYVVNAFRNLTHEPAEAAAVLREIEAASHLNACGVVNNSHLCDETTADDVENGRTWARAVADELGLPLVATCVPARVAKTCNYRETGSDACVVVGRYVNTPWQ